MILVCVHEEDSKDFVHELTKLRSAIREVRTIVEHSLVRESLFNGFVEVGVKTVEDVVRAMKSET